jgi:hypothetical protein
MIYRFEAALCVNQYEFRTSPLSSTGEVGGVNGRSENSIIDFYMYKLLVFHQLLQLARCAAQRERRIGGFGCLARLRVDQSEIRGNDTADDAFCINTLCVAQRTSTRRK